jgi:tRNA G10  N-methylase Trm11
MHILARACRPSDLVLDPFAGSGSSRDAAARLGLAWRGCDIDPQFAGTQITARVPADYPEQAPCRG